MKRDRRKAREDRLPKPKSEQFDVRRLARKHAWLGAVILATVLAYANSLHAPFLLDNTETIVRDSRVHAFTLDHLSRILGGAYYQAIVAGLYRPFTTLTYLFNYAVLGNGANPAGYHWFNLVVHCANVALVYALGLAIFAELPAALALSALWGLHPVLTESVTNIVGRADLLAAFGVLAGLLSYRASLRSSGAARTRWLAAIALSTAIGLFSKESAIVAIAVVALYDLAFERERAWRPRLAGYAAVAIPSVVFLAARAYVLGRLPAGPSPFTDNPLLGAGFWTARMTAFRVIGKYLGLLAWPAQLSPDYSYNEIPVVVDATAVLSLLLCLAVAAVAIRAWRRNKPLFFAIAFFFVTLAPTSNLVIRIGSIMGERFLYLPAVGFAAAVVYALRPWLERRPVAAIGCVVLLAFTVRVYARNLDWLDERRFWQKAVQAAPGSYKTRITAAAASPRNTREEWDHSIGDAERALATLDGLPDALNSAYAYRQAGVLYRERGDRMPGEGGAAEWYGKSLRALLRSERIERALDQRYRQENAARGTPQGTFLPSVIYLELGRTYLRMNDVRQAIAMFETGRNLESDPDLLQELGAAYVSLGDMHKGAQAYVEALEVDSSRAALNQTLMEVYRAADPRGCAVAHSGGGESLNINCPMVHADICAASQNVAENYLRRNQLEEAASIRQVAASDLGCLPGTRR